MNMVWERTCKFILYKDMFNQPIWIAASVVEADAKTCQNSKIQRPETNLLGYWNKFKQD